MQTTLPQRRRLRAAIWIIPATLLLGASIVQARVYQRWTARDRVSAYLASVLTQTVYAGSVMLNGGSGELVIHTLDVPLDEALQAIGQADPALQLTRISRGLAVGLLRDGDRVTRLVLVHPPGTVSALVFQMAQTAAAFEQSARPPSTAAIDGIPTLPGANLQFFAQDLHAGASLAVAVASVSAQTAMASLDQQFITKGWERLLPGPTARRGGSPASTFQWYRSGDTLCALLLTAAVDGNGTTITLLHKRPGME